MAAGNPAARDDAAAEDGGGSDNMRILDTRLRVCGGPAAIAYVHFAASDTPRPAPPPIPVRLYVPLSRDGRHAATARTHGIVQLAAVNVESAHGQPWAQIELGVTGRTVVTITPKP